jgi:2-oxoglutarate dehydrogenase complex dehydrogenase (E1) component-like enzyme
VDAEAETKDTLNCVAIATSFQVRGHKAADLNPLGKEDSVIESNIEGLDAEFYGYEKSDMDREIQLGTEVYGGILG